MRAYQGEGYGANVAEKQIKSFKEKAKKEILAHIYNDDKEVDPSRSQLFEKEQKSSSSN